MNDKLVTPREIRDRRNAILRGSATLPPRNEVAQILTADAATLPSVTEPAQIRTVDVATLAEAIRTVQAENRTNRNRVLAIVGLVLIAGGIVGGAWWQSGAEQRQINKDARVWTHELECGAHDEIWQVAHNC